MADASPAVRDAVALGGVLACVSAAVALGLPVLFTGPTHVVVPRGWSHAKLSGVIVHRRDLDAEDVCGVATTLLRTVIDCARELPLREALVICDAALRAGLDRSRLREAAKSLRGPGAAKVRDVARLCDAQAESPIETLLRLIAREFGRVDPQVWIDGVGRVDLILDGWLVLEADGFEFHSTRAHYREDRRRANALVAAGYVLLRFSYEDVVHHPDYVAETIRRVLAQGRP